MILQKMISRRMALRRARAIAFGWLIFVCTLLAAAQPPGPNEMPAVIQVPEAARPSPNFDAVAATNAYLAEIPADKMARSDAYFEGGYWLTLWDFLYGVAVALLLLNTRWSAKMRDLAERLTRFKPLQTFFYWVEYFILVSVLTFPLTVYEDYIREHKYGLATQTFGPWMGDQLKDLGVGLVLGGILVTLLFGIARRLRENWWIWGAVASFGFLVFVSLISPIYIVPIFNKVTPLNDPKVVDPILRLARMNGIPAKDVYQIDASRQTTRMSANVSGFGNTMRITLNDNLLRRGSPEEIQAVMGHEMGHYVLNHVYKGLTFGLIVVVVAFAYLHWALRWTRQRWGDKWQIRDIGDTAVLPLVVLLVTVFFFVITPILNGYIRTQEYEADMYGLNTARQPDGAAQGAIHLGEYRKMNPGPIEEWIFYDHPSGRNRIYAAMRWKAENLSLFAGEAQMTPVAPAASSADSNKK
jgi:STE24 endopeptidase